MGWFWCSWFIPHKDIVACGLHTGKFQNSWSHVCMMDAAWDAVVIENILHRNQVVACLKHGHSLGRMMPGWIWQIASSFVGKNRNALITWKNWSPPPFYTLRWSRILSLHYSWVVPFRIPTTCNSHSDPNSSTSSTRHGPGQPLDRDTPVSPPSRGNVYPAPVESQY